MTTLSWSDTFAAGTSYNVEQQGSDGTWATIDSVPSGGGSGSALSWTHATNATTTLRVAAARTGYEVPLDTVSGNSSVQIAVPASFPTIVLNQAQPVSGTVGASIGAGGQYGSVTWFVDLNKVGSSTVGPGYAVTFNTSALTTGAHLLLAQLAVSPDFSLDVRLTVQVVNSEVAVAVSVTGTSGPVDINVTATSQFGITSVTASLDGNALGTLTAPNDCRFGDTACSTYQFPVNATTVGSGPHTITAQATDQNGKTASSTIPVTFSNPPSLALTSPFDGALVNGSLPITGSFGTDKQGVTVSLAVTLGQLPVLKASSSPFSGSFSLAGVKPGTYTLTAVATDSTGQSSTLTDLVTVTSSTSVTYSPVFTLGSSNGILAAAGSYVLYTVQSDGSVHLHSPAGDAVLPLGMIQDLALWQLTDTGIVFARGSGSDRPGDFSVYMWPPGGAAQNLSTAAGSMGIDDELMAVHYPWVLWNSTLQNGSDSDVLYNVSSAAQLGVVPPSGTSAVNNTSDFFSTNGALTLIYWTLSSSSSTTAVTNVLRWDQATNTSLPLTSDNQSGAPQTDGIRVAWQSGVQPPVADGSFTLNALDLASGTTQVLSTTMSKFQLASGVIGWLEQTTSSQAIKASDGTSTSTVSSVLGSTFFGSSGGYVVFEENESLYAWSPAGGRQLIFDAQPGQVSLAGKTVYFTNGNQQVVYAVALP